VTFRIFITGSGISAEAQKLLEKEDCIFMVGNPLDSPEDIAERLKAFDPDGLIVRQGKINSLVLDAARGLKVICKHGVGTDNIDVNAATDRRIPVFYTPGANFESVAEHTLALILSLTRKIPEQDKRIRNGIFEKKNYDGLELTGKILGIIGFGLIGRRLMELVAPFQMNVIVYHPSITDEVLPKNVRKANHMNMVLEQSDIISLHCPLTSETRGMINKNTIALMKENVILVNTARGGIINEFDLAQALQDGKIKAAALDVFDTEPPRTDNPLFSLENIIFTTHTAGISDNSYKNMGMTSVKHVLSVLKGIPIDRNALINKNYLTND